MLIYNLTTDLNQPVKLQWLVSTLPQDSPIRGGTLNTQRALQKVHVSHLQITREDLILFNKLSASHLASIHTCWEHICLPKPQIHIWPIH